MCKCITSKHTKIRDIRLLTKIGPERSLPKHCLSRGLQLNPHIEDPQILGELGDDQLLTLTRARHQHQDVDAPIVEETVINTRDLIESIRRRSLTRFLGIDS